MKPDIGCRAVSVAIPSGLGFLVFDAAASFVCILIIGIPCICVRHQQASPHYLVSYHNVLPPSMVA